jgi:predicted RND superfamily exporter protein
MRPRHRLLERHALRPLALGLHRAHRFALRRPRAVLAAAALLAAAMLMGLTQGRMALSIREMVDPDTRASRWLAQMEEAFGGGHQAVLLFSPAESGRFLAREDLAAIRAFVARELARNPELLRAMTPWDARRATRVEGRLRLVPVVEGDAPEGLEALAATPYGGILTDGRDVAIELVLRDTPHRSLFGRFDPRPLGALLARARAEVLGARPGLEVRMTGAAAFEWYTLRAQDSITLLNAVVVVLLVVLFRVLLGTWRSGLLIALVVGWAGAIVYGGMALSGMPIDMLSTGLFLLLAVAAIEDFVFVAWERLARGAHWRRAFRVLLLPGALTSLTTFVGFASLGTADAAIVRRFGLWGAIGAALEWIATFLVLPALLTLAPRLRPFADASRALATQAAERLVGRQLPRWAAGAALLVVAAGVWGSAHLDFTDSPGSWFSDRHPFNQAAAYTLQTRGWLGQVNVVFPEDASMREVAAFSRELSELPGVARVLDPSSILTYWTGGEPTALFELAAEVGPGRIGDLIGEGGRMRAAVFLSDAGLAAVGGVRDAVARRFPDGDGFPAGELVSYADFGEAVPQTLLRSLATCLLLVGLLIALLYRSVGIGWGGRAALSSALGPMAALAAVWAFGLHVNFVTAVFASVLVGLTGDNAVQFACAARGRSLRGAISHRGGAAALVTVVMALCALTFLGSTFVPPRILGLLLAGGLVAAVVGDVWVLRALCAPREPPAGRAEAPQG